MNVCEQRSPVLDVINIVGERGERRLFERLNFQVGLGECLLVQGENGSGKTTLLRTLAGLTKPAAGVIKWKGDSLHSQWGEYQCDMLYCGHSVGLKDDLSAMENLLIMAALANVSASPDRVSDALHEVGLAGRGNLPVRALSQGQKRRASLARLLLHKRTLWILDEPLTALDRSAAHWLGEMINQHQTDGGMVVLTSHQDLRLTNVTHTIRMGA